MKVSNNVKVPEYCLGKISPYHKGENIYDLFVRMAEKFPDNTAVIAEGTEYSYSRMKKLIDDTASYLYNCGIRAGDRAALTGSRRVYTIAAIYALLKIGAAYVPLEDNYPQKRVEYILSDCGADKLIITDPHFKFISSDIVTVDLCGEKHGTFSDTEIMKNAGDNPCCYIIYTSGTTGKPKGTSIRSDDLLNLVYWYIDELSLDSSSRVLLLNAFGFDASVKNIFAPLLTGGTLILGSSNLYNIGSILDIMRTWRPTAVNCVPGLFAALTEADRNTGYNAVSSLEYAVLGGERLNKTWAEKLYKDIGDCKLKVLNVYGPTECTSVSSSMKYTLKELAECENVSIGRPIYNKRIYILDENGRSLGKGEKGEIVISGTGIADNYLNKKAADVFCKDIFCDTDIMYRSGDLGYYDENGNIFFCGRRDSQVKINGHRIELEEIIKTGLKCSGSVWFDVVITENRLVGFIKDSCDRSEEIRNAMKEWCMDYMVPSQIISVESVPMTSHGKTDYDALKALVKEHMGQKKKQSPCEGTQKIISDIWSELLGHSDFGTDDKFFDVGGNSLHLFKMEMMIKEKTGIDIELVKLMNSCSIEKIAEIIEGDNKSHEASSVRNDKMTRSRNKFRERMEMLKAQRKRNDPKSENVSAVGSMPQLKNVFEIALKDMKIKTDDSLDFKNKECEIFREEQAKRQILKDDENNTIYLEKNDISLFENHCSTRVFDVNKTMSFSSFSSVLSVLMSRNSRKYTRYYPSAGGLYPLDIYLYVKKDKVEKINEGVYYYSPVKNALIRKNCNGIINRDLYFGSNQNMFCSSAFSMYMVYRSCSNMPKYGTLGYALALVDAGVMAEALYVKCCNTEDIGICSVGDMDFDRLGNVLGLESVEIPVHAVEIGLKMR